MYYWILLLINCLVWIPSYGVLTQGIDGAETQLFSQNIRYQENQDHIRDIIEDGAAVDGHSLPVCLEAVHQVMWRRSDPVRPIDNKRWVSTFASAKQLVERGFYPAAMGVEEYRQSILGRLESIWSNRGPLYLEP